MKSRAALIYIIVAIIHIVFLGDLSFNVDKCERVSPPKIDPSYVLLRFHLMFAIFSKKMMLELLLRIWNR